MADRRPCRICRCWFDVDPRAGRRHTVCGAEACQRARSQRASARWRKRNPDKVKAYRLRGRLAADPPPAAEVAVLDPIAAFDEVAVRHAVGVEVSVVIEQVAKVILSLARHGVLPKWRLRGRDSPKVPPPGARHETAAARAPP